MEKSLEKYLKNSSYDTIFKVLNRGYFKKGFFKKKVLLSDIDKVEVNKFIESEIKKILLLDKTIPLVIVNNYSSLHINSKEEIENTIASFTIPKITSVFFKYSEHNFTRITDFKSVYDKLLFECCNFKSKYGFIFEKISTTEISLIEKGIYVMINRCKLLLLQEQSEKNIFTTLFSISEVYANEKRTEIRKKLLELLQLFLVHVDKYFEYSFRKYKTVKLNISETNQHIIKYFIDIFWEIKSLVDWSLLFNKIQVVQSLFSSIDRILIHSFGKITISNISQNEILNIFCTLNFVSEILFEMTTVGNDIGIPPNSYKFNVITVISRIEKQLYEIVRKRLKRKIDSIPLDDKFSSTFINIFKSELSSSLFDISKNVINIYLEIFMNILFAIVINSSVNFYMVDKIISSVCDIESYLSTVSNCIPLLKNIKNYLKIVSFPVQDPKLFIENYILYSNNNINLQQIIKILKFNKKTSKKLIATYNSLIQ